MDDELAVDEPQDLPGDGELEAVRDQLQGTAGRLHECEENNDAMRSRLTLRQQELEEAQHAIDMMRSQPDVTELRARLDAVEQAWAETLRRLEELDVELGYARATPHSIERPPADVVLTEETLASSSGDALDEQPVTISSTQWPSLPKRIR